MSKKLILSLVTAATIGVGLIASTTSAQAYHHGGFSGPGLGFFFGSPGYYNDGYYNNDHYGRYPYFRHAYRSCHIGNIRYHHRMHKARICNGQVTRIY